MSLIQGATDAGRLKAIASFSYNFTCVFCANAVSLIQGATDAGRLKAIASFSVCNSAIYVIFMRTLACGGRFPTLTVNTS